MLHVFFEVAPVNMSAIAMEQDCVYTAISLHCKKSVSIARGGF